MIKSRDEINASDPILCRCEEIRRSEILFAIGMGCRSVAAVKKFTRAGMGACQGRTCARLIEQLLVASGISPEDAAARDKARFPIVPCPIGAFEKEE
ncbi:MAG: (2Fe-2S)-binding protein [Bacillota bacterium]